VEIAPDARGGRRGEDVVRADAVETVEGDAAALVLANDADQVDHRVAAGHPRFEAAGRAEDVALDALDGLEPVEIRFRPPAHEASHDVALGPKGLDHGPPHEPRGARDVDPVHRSGIVSSPPRVDAKIAE